MGKHQDNADADLFLSAMAGVRPLDGTTPRVPPPEHAVQTSQAALSPNQAQQKQAQEDALALVELQEWVDGQGPFRVLRDHTEPDAGPSVMQGDGIPHSGAAPGVNNALLSQLRQGGFAYHRTLDLHGMIRDAAQSAVRRFIHDARRDGERCVLIITGRGQKSPGGVAVLREALPEWLSHAPLNALVLAFAMARPEDGGPGAFYVLLRRPAAPQRPSGRSGRWK